LDAQTGKGRWSHTNIRESLSAIAVTADGKTVIGGGYSGLTWWDAQAGKVRQTSREHKNGIGALALAPDGRTLASGDVGESSGIYLWEVVRGEVRSKLAGHRGMVRSLAFTPDSRTLIAASQRPTKSGEKAVGEVNLWDLQNEKAFRSLEVPGGAWTVAVSPDGQLLAVGSGAFQEGQSPKGIGHVHLWDLQSGKLVRSAEGGEGAIAAVAFAPDGQSLALASWDGTVRLWDVSNWLAAKPAR
jgi:WD40 repeat protein